MAASLSLDARRTARYMAPSVGQRRRYPSAGGSSSPTPLGPWSAVLVIRQTDAMPGVPLKRDGSPIAVTNPVKVTFEVLETLPGGKTVRKKIDANAFTSESPATLDPKDPVTIQGTATTLGHQLRGVKNGEKVIISTEE